MRGDWWPCLLSKGHEGLLDGSHHRLGNIYHVTLKTSFHAAGTNGTADEAGSGGRGAGTSATVDAALSGAGKGAFDLAGAVSIAEATKRLQKAFALGTGSRVFLGTLDAQILNTSEAATIDSTGYKAAGGGRGRRSSACLGTGSGGAGKGAFNLGGAISIAKAGNGITEADTLGA